MKAPLEDIAGKKFELLEAIALKECHPKQGQIWLCLCKCGSNHIVRRSNLVAGNVKSCGCLQKEAARKNIRKAADNIGPRSEQKRPDVSINFHAAMRSWFKYGKQAYPVRSCDIEILRAAIRYRLKGRKFAEEDEVMLCQEALDDQERWWLLLRLEEKRIPLKLYLSEDEARSWSK